MLHSAFNMHVKFNIDGMAYLVIDLNNQPIVGL